MATNSVVRSDFARISATLPLNHWLVGPELVIRNSYQIVSPCAFSKACFYSFGWLFSLVCSCDVVV